MRILFAPFIFLFILACENKQLHPSSFNDSEKETIAVDKVERIFLKPNVSSQDRIFLQDEFSQFIKRRRFNGSILIVKNNEVVFDTVVGFADIRRRIPLEDTSAIQLASISKPITAAVILSLIQEGKLYLTDSVTKYLPNLPTTYHDITIQMLLSHQSGLTQYYYYCDHILQNKELVLSNDSLISIIHENEPGFAGRPGRKFSYCNTNYALLASVAEKLEGKSFHEIVQERIIRPSGMENSFLLDLNRDELPQNLVYGNNEWNKTVDFDYLDGIVGDKGFFSTAHDLLKFDSYFFNCLMVDDSLMNQAFSPQSKIDRNNSSYGLGWRIRFNEELGKVLYHPGWWRGNRHIYFKIPSKNYTVIMLSNSLRGSRYNLNELLELFYNVE